MADEVNLFGMWASPYSRRLELPYEYVFITTRKVSFTTGKEQEEAIAELTEQLKLLENELKGKPSFAVEAIGYLDIVVANFFVFWFRNLQEALGFNMFTKEKF
ncbi:hypothetical protein V6N13_063714 [Hibiscus sabdariffa]|uniref:Glutathione S-transferase C-terminal domain-containing protein n=1 Tax=Hibiscus sabdariffa TaxID=183260 RepID=A0ABR2R126_9ROSI